MKNLSIFLLLSTLGSCGWAQDLESQLLGSWQVVSAEGREMPEKHRAVFELKKDGSCSIRKGKRKAMSCTWTMKKDGTLLAIKSDRGELTMEDLKIEAKTMTATFGENGKKGQAILEKQQ